MLTSLSNLFLAFSFPPEWMKDLINAASKPEWFITLSIVVFLLMFIAYKWWTKPVVFWTIFVGFCIFYFGSTNDPNFKSIVAKPDNVPITMMVLSVMLCIWLGFRRAALNDSRVAAGLPLLEEDKDDKVLVWPDLVYTELICLILATAGLIVWAIISKAPLEQPANPGYAPNPAKAPWYFLGLQEMLVYFDPWMAGVVYPGLIIVGLMAMPYIDTNPRGNGYYTLRERPFAMVTWLFGFLILWVVLIFFGTFLRGPNWSFFGPYEFWDSHKAEALNNRDISNLFWNEMLGRARPTDTNNPGAPVPFWLVREWLGFAIMGVYLLIVPVILRFTVFNRMYEQMGAIRYVVMVFHLLLMALMPIKMVLRWLFNLKYFIYLPEFNANLWHVASDAVRSILDEARQALSAGQLDRALNCLRAISTLHRNDSAALHEAGVLLAGAQRFSESIEYFDLTLAANPNFARAHFNLGLALRMLGYTDRAIDELRHAMRLAPDAVEPITELADLIGGLDRNDEALDLLDAAQDRFVASDRFHATRGHLLKRAGRFEEAAESLRKAVELARRSVNHRCNLALVLNELGRSSEADQAIAPVLSANPPANIRLRSAVMFPAVPESIDQNHASRARLNATLDQLLTTNDRIDDPVTALNSIPFYLAYAGLDDRPILEKLAAVHEHICPSLNFTATHIPQRRPLRGRIRLGILSTNLYSHTIGKLNIGLIEQLDRTRFEVFVLETGVDDSITKRIRASADHLIRAPRSFAAARQAIANCELDTAFYPDIGMTPLTYYLAFARLAPIQCVTWGHPLTSGLKSLDYFISAKHLESEGSQTQYVERLHCLSVPGTCYARPEFTPIDEPRSHFGFDRNWRLYVCPQSLFKIHPEFDATLARILREDPAGRIIFVAGNNGAMFPALRDRLARSMGADIDRVVLVPKISTNEFLALLSIADANLDPFHFGGGNTSLEAFAVGCPIVTLPSAQLRGRITYALYQQMGHTDCVVSNPDEYVKTAVRLANDQAWRKQQRGEILARNHRLFENRQVVREFEEFFARALTANEPAQ